MSEWSNSVLADGPGNAAVQDVNDNDFAKRCPLLPCVYRCSQLLSLQMALSATRLSSAAYIHGLLENGRPALMIALDRTLGKSSSHSPERSNVSEDGATKALRTLRQGRDDSDGSSVVT